MRELAVAFISRIRQIHANETDRRTARHPDEIESAGDHRTSILQKSDFVAPQMIEEGQKTVFDDHLLINIGKNMSGQ